MPHFQHKCRLVLNFRSQSNVPNYLGRAYQRRLLYLAGGLLLVVFLMSQAAKPGNWSWFFYITYPERHAEIDTTAPPSSKPPRLPGAFVAPSPKKRTVRYDPKLPFHERIQPELLRPLKDNEKFTPADREPFAHLVQILKDADAATIQAAPAERASYVQLWSQSQQYRGRLVTVVGRVRGVQLKKVRPEEFGIEQYYEVWLQHDGTSNTSNPIAIFCLELPEGFPLSMKIDERAEITGFYYRRWWYLAGDRPRVAPLVVAKTLDWQPTVAASEGEGMAEFSVPLLIGLVATAALIALVVVIYLCNRGGSDELPDYVRRHMKGADADSFDEAELGLSLREEPMERLDEGERNGDPGPSSL